MLREEGRGRGGGVGGGRDGVRPGRGLTGVSCVERCVPFLFRRCNLIELLVSCTIKALVSCTSSVRCNSGSRLGGRFPVSVTAHVLCISRCLVPAHVQI